MEKTEFIATMEEFASEYGEVEIKQIDKPEMTYTGLMIKKAGPTPVVNLDMLYEDYVDGKSLEMCYQVIRKILTMTPKTPIDTSIITDWNKAREHLEIRMFETHPGGEIYDEFEGMYFVPYITVMENGGVRVTPEILEIWKDVSIAEVFERAALNTAKQKGWE